jgi:hypothetical protein
MSAIRIPISLALLLCLSSCQREPLVATAEHGVLAAAIVPKPPEPRPDAALDLPGAFAEATTLADFQKRFGRSVVRIDEVRETDGSVMRSLVLFPDDPARRAYVRFHDDETLTGLASIMVNDRGSLWRGKGGVHVGMSFAALREANGKPFYLSGFDEQHRGWVRDQWSPALDDDDDKLGALDVEDGEHMYFGVDLGVRGDATALPAGTLPREDSVSSDDPAFPRLGEFVEVTAITAYTSLDDEWQ